MDRDVGSETGSHQRVPVLFYQTFSAPIHFSGTTGGQWITWASMGERRKFILLSWSEAKGPESCQRLFTNRLEPWLCYEPIRRSPGCPLNQSAVWFKSAFPPQKVGQGPKMVRAEPTYLSTLLHWVTKPKGGENEELHTPLY